MPRLPKPGSTAQEYVTFTTVQWHNHDAFYAFWVERWKRVVDYLRSLHWRVLMEVDQKQIPEWRRFPIINLTLSFFSDYVSQYLQSRVRFSAVPNNPQAIPAAELADQVLKFMWDKLNMDEHRTDLAAWLCATGNADLRFFWDTNTGNQLPFALPDGQGGLIPINPQTMQPDPSMKEPIMVDAGEVGVEVIAPQLVRWNPKTALGVIVGYLMTYDEAVARYGDQIADQLSYQTVSGPLTTDLMSVFPQTLSSGMPAKEPAALIMEHYLPRSSRNPGGLWWTASDNKIVVTTPQPLPARQVPIVHFRWVPLPGWPTLGMSPLYDITWSNKHLDEMTARMLEWLNKVTPKIIRHTGDGLKYGEITDEPGQEVVVQPGSDPVWPNIPAFPQQFMETRQAMTDDALTVGGYKMRRDEKLPQGSPTSPMRTPPRMRNEGENVQLAIINSKASWERCGYIILDYVARFYTESRSLAVIGTDKTYQWREFKGADLDNLEATIHVDELPLYSWNRQSMRDTVIGVLSSPAGAILFAGPDGQPDKNKIDAAMNAVGIDVAPDALDHDVLEARNENNMFSSGAHDPQPDDQGQPQEGTGGLQIDPWNNHETHLAEHSKVPKTMQFKAWPPGRKQAFLQHMSGHEQAISDAQKQQEQKMLDTETSLRNIKADAETKQDVRTELGKALADALVQLLMPKAEKETEGAGKNSPFQKKGESKEK